jgi:hypothetical protein
VNAPEQRLDEAKIETLRTWGEGLRADPREEVRAAGRAITMLAEEIERLNIDLWHSRTDVRPAPGAEDAGEGDAPAAERRDHVKVALPPPLPAF